MGAGRGRPSLGSPPTKGKCPQPGSPSGPGAEMDNVDSFSSAGFGSESILSKIHHPHSISKKRDTGPRESITPSKEQLQASVTPPWGSITQRAGSRTAGPSRGQGPATPEQQPAEHSLAGRSPSWWSPQPGRSFQSLSADVKTLTPEDQRLLVGAALQGRGRVTHSSPSGATVTERSCCPQTGAASRN